MSAIARLAEPELGAPRDDGLAEIDEGAQHVAQRHHFRALAVQRDHIDWETRLQRGVAPQLIEHHVGHRLAPQFDDDAHPVAVGFVAQIGDALDFLFAHQIGDALDQRRLVHLIGNLADDDRFAILARRLDPRAGAHDDRAAPGGIGVANAAAPENRRGGREVRPRHDLHQFRDGHIGAIDHRDGGVDHLAEIMRRNIGGHADGDAARAIDQKIGKARRKDGRLVFLVVVIGLEVDSAFVDVLEQRERGLCEARLGVTHRGGRIVVDRTEIALPVDQHQAHREGLRHAHQRVVNRRVAVRVIFTHHVADDARRLHMRLVGRVAVLVHRIKDAPMHRLQPVAHVGKRAAHDHAHRVIEIAALHFVGDGHRTNIGTRRTRSVFFVCLFGQGRRQSESIVESSLFYR